MKQVGILRTAFILFLVLGASAFVFAQRDQQDDKQHTRQQDQPRQHTQQQDRGRQEQHTQQQDRGRQQHTQQQDRGWQQQHTQQQDRGRELHTQRTQQPLHTQRQSPGGRGQRDVWQQHRARSWESEHRTWGQRGGYNGYRVPEPYFRSHYGRRHWFRIYRQPFLVVGGYPRFRYGRYWFSFLDPYPEYWGPTWYETDDVYVEYFGDGYYLYNRRYPGRPGIAVSISF